MKTPTQITYDIIRLRGTVEDIDGSYGTLEEAEADFKNAEAGEHSIVQLIRSEWQSLYDPEERMLVSSEVLSEKK